MMKAFDRDVWAIFGMPIDNVTLDQAVGLVERAVIARERLSFVTPNVNWLVRSLKNDVAMRQIINADLSLPDGAPVVWLARQLGMPIKERVAGSDLFDRLRFAQKQSAVPIRVFFFGGRDGSAKAAHEAISQDNGRMVAAGWHNPGFGDVESMSSAEIRYKINAANPDFLIVSLGAAKGQAWIERNQSELEVPAIAHLGAVVDFVAGSIKRAPRWGSRLGLEWVWRIFAEPSLWRRYWNDGTDFVGLTSKRLGILKRISKPRSKTQPISAVTTPKGLKISGDLVHAHRSDLADKLKTAAQVPGDCALDLTEIGAIDASGLGQVRMLEQCLTRRGNRLEILASNTTKPAMEAANMTLQGVSQR